MQSIGAGFSDFEQLSEYIDWTTAKYPQTTSSALSYLAVRTNSSVLGQVAIVESTCPS